MKSLKILVESNRFEKFITFIIILNAVTLGLETDKTLSQDMFNFLVMADRVFLGIFVLELLLKLFLYQKRYFQDPWRVFDFVIVSIALIPSSGPLSVLRSLRILRTLRMLSVVPSLKKVVSGLLIAIPGLGAVLAIIGLIFYIGAVIATKVFGDLFPHWFGSLWQSVYSLFQIMTLESWSMGIVRPVMQEFPYAWLFFLPFILITTFTMLNLFIAVIVNAMQAETDAHAQERAEQGQEERARITQDISEIKQKLSALVEQTKK